MLAVTVEFLICEDHIEEFQQAMTAQALNSLEKEQACRQFDVCLSADNPQLIFLYELYEDRRAFDAHLASEHFIQFDGQTKHWVLDKTVRIWQVSEQQIPFSS